MSMIVSSALSLRNPFLPAPSHQTVSGSQGRGIGRKPGFLFPAAVFLLLASSAAAQPQQPTGLNAFHRSGQTFLTWTERGEISGEQYRVYRHSEPITAANRGEASLVATLSEGSSAYHTERMRGMDYPPEQNGGYRSLRNYVIEPLGPQLPDDTGLLVWTVEEGGMSYYAVSTVLDGVENQRDFGPGNTFGPVTETAVDPEPVLVWQSPGGRGRVYTQFMNYARWNPTYETPDGPTYAYNYFVGYPTLEQCGGEYPETYALLLHIEGHGSRYEAGDGSHYFGCVELWCDDPRQSWYYGYSATHDYWRDGGSPVTTGPIVNFTEERLQRAIYDILRDPLYSDIDPRRIFAYGHSMGASGSLALALRYPNLFAGVYCSEPMTNYRAASQGCEVDWVGTDLEPKWGAVALNLPIENRGVYAAHLTRFNGTGVWDWQNHQATLVQRRGEDIAFVALAHGTRDRVIAWESQGRPAYEPLYQGRHAFSGATVNEDHTWVGFAGLGPAVGEQWLPRASGPFWGFRMVRDETLPALTYASGSLPVPPDSAGEYNMNIEWSASWNAWAGPPVDSPARWEIALRSLEGAQTVDVTPRRVQRFVITPGATYDWENRTVSDNRLIASGTVTADADGLVTVSQFVVSPDGNRLVLVPHQGGAAPTATPTPPITATFTPTSTPVPTPTQLPTSGITPTGTMAPTRTPAPTPVPTGTPTPAGPLSVPLEVRLPDGTTGKIPITVGVPLPPGDWDSSRFTVLDPRGPVPSQIRAAVRSGPGGSISWLLVDFQAERGQTYRLEAGTPPSPSRTITITNSGDEDLIVDTGAGRYHVERNSGILGNVIGMDGAVRIDRGLWNNPPQPASVEVEEAGPLRAVVTVRAPEAVHGLDLVARLHFYAGLPYIRARLTLVNHHRALWGYEAPNADNGDCEVSDSQPVIQGLNSPGTVMFDDITWSLELAETTAPEEVLYQDSSGTDQWNFYVGQGPRMQSGVTRRGFVRTRNGVEAESGNYADGVMTAGGVRVEIPWFREQFPKALRARGGRLEIGLFPGEYAIDHRLRAGEQKTHDVWISLDPAISLPYHTVVYPAFAWMRSTHGLGYIGPRRYSGYYGEYEDYLDAQFDPNRENRDGLARSIDDAQQRWDLFGWMDFGDLPTDFEDGRSPYNLKYDVGLGFIHQALRTGGANWWKWAETSNRHFADIDIFHSRASGYMAGRAWFEGGAWGHSLHDESGLTNPHRNCNNPNTDLYYGFTGMAAWALLTGDEVVRAAALEMAENTLWRIRNTADDPTIIEAWGGGTGEGYGLGTLRAAANVQRILVWAWRLTGDAAYLRAAGRTSRWYMLNQRDFERASWPSALFGRSHGEYILAARDAGIPLDPDALPALEHVLRSMANHMMREGDRAWFSGVTGDEINAWMLLAADAFALGTAATGDSRWLLEYAVPCFNTGARDPFYPGDLSHYHSSKELVNTVAAGTIFLHFATGEGVEPTSTPTPTPPPSVTPTPGESHILGWGMM